VTLLGSSAEPVRARPPSLLGTGISTRDRQGPGGEVSRRRKLVAKAKPLCLTGSS
jgi:hypothetical protein